MRPYSANACPSGVGWPSRPNIRSRHPLGDPQRAEVGRLLREAQRLLTTGEIRASILEVRRALEWIRAPARRSATCS
ncbi:hypothetical protein [Streptomyces sp. NPDC055692]|uniref:hypothetical protein n=1 Tax=Streptomyces sp. NPDC055692 TaxID=3155683 RepID=UPI00341573BA